MWHVNGIRIFSPSNAVSKAALQYHSHDQPADLHAYEISALHLLHSIPALCDCYDQFINECEMSWAASETEAEKAPCLVPDTQLSVDRDHKWSSQRCFLHKYSRKPPCIQCSCNMSKNLYIPPERKGHNSMR